MLSRLSKMKADQQRKIALCLAKYGAKIENGGFQMSSNQRDHVNPFNVDNSTNKCGRVWRFRNRCWSFSSIQSSGQEVML